MNRPNPTPWRQRILISIASALLAGGGAFNQAQATPLNGAATVSVAQATQLGPHDKIIAALPASTPMHIVVSLNLRQRAQLSQFIADATDLSVVVPQRRMTRAQFNAAHAPTLAQANAVKQYLSDQGFTNITIAPNRLLVSAYGDADVVTNAFQTSLVRVQTARGETAYANTTAARMPLALQDTVQTVLGLQTVHHPRTMERYAKVRGPATTHSITGHNPVDFAHIYGADSLPTASTVTVGVITQGDVSQTITDLNAFTNQNSLPQVNSEVVTVGSGSTDTSGVGEWNLDTQSIIGMSGGVQKLVLYTADTMSFADLTSAMNAAVNDATNNPRVINMSFGACEFQGSATQAEDQVFQNAIAIGMTFSASSGDDGANCDKNGTYGVADPASSPHVVAVGGTTLNTSAGNYVAESAWSDGGGGISTFQPKPSWQTMVSGNFRSVPDVAFDGDPSSGALILVNGSTHQIGGTSLSSPIFVGAWARILADNPSLTFAAPYLYQNLTAGDYNDVTTGSNATAQSGGNYSAGNGFDQTTGFGSFKMAQVASDLGQPGPPSVSTRFTPYSIGVNDTSTVTISLSNASQPSDAAVLSADFIDTLPTGLTVAATPNASTTCTGTVSATAASSTITLPSGSSIPAASACTITVDVSAVGNGIYVNTIAAGALQTTIGGSPNNNAYAASATLTVGNGLSNPVASISPGSLNFALLTNTSGNQTATVANTGGGTLTYSFDEASTSAQPMDTVNYQWDDGSSEQTDALAGGGKEYAAVWLNRFAVSGPVTINTLSIFWPTQTSGTLVGKQPNLLAYYDADGDGDPSNAVRLGGDNLVNIDQMGAFQTYNVNLQIPAAGDIYVGFSDVWANDGSSVNLEPAAEDTDSPQGHSYIVYNGTGDRPDLSDLSQNTDGGVLNANLLIRATGTTSYSTTACDSPADVAWLSETPTSGSVIGGHSEDVTVTADATGMANGDYSALLCATTSDPEHTSIQVPVTLHVGTTNLPPTADFTVSSNGLSASFTDASSDSDGTVTGWSWDFGDGSALSATQNPTHTYAAAGTYTVTLTVTDDDADTGTTSVPVTVAPAALVPPSLTTSFAPDTITAGETSTVTITFTNPNATLATLSSTFRDNLPSGLTTVANSVASTCGGSNDPTQTATRFTLPNHSTIPASGSCTMTGNVTTSTAGSYTNTLAEGALKTDAGNNANPAAATLTVNEPVPMAVVTPNALAFSVPVDGNDSDVINIANQGNGDLTWSMAEAAPQIRLNVVRDQRFTPGSRASALPQATLNAIAVSGGSRSATVNGVPAGSFLFQADPGVYDNSLGLGNSGTDTEYAAVFLNRFAPDVGSAPFTINTISVMWPTQQIGSLLGLQARLVAYYDADADGDPSNAVFLGQSLVNVDILDVFQTYHVSFNVPGDGDIYVGFENAWAEQGSTPSLFAAAEDTSYLDYGAAYLYGMADGSPPYLLNLANNSLGGSLDDLGAPGNLLIRASGTKDGGPTANCTNPSLVPWLTESSSSGTVAANSDTGVTIGVDATGMAAGSYSALICVSTNDPLHAVVEVPIGLTVTACDGPTDRIFADGFDGTGSGCSVPPPTIVSGSINETVQSGDFNGLSVDLAAGTWGAYPHNNATDDVNIYDIDGNGTAGVYWFGDTAPAGVGGTVDVGLSVAILHSGDTVGPGIAFSPASNPLDLWAGSHDAYIGIAFWNETTGKLDYGYIHVISTSPAGLPMQITDYAYNADGGPITIP